MPARPPASSDAGLHVSVDIELTPGRPKRPAKDAELPPKTLAIQRARTGRLPTLGFSLVPLFRLLDYTNVATVVGAALAGQKILFVSREISSLTQTVSLAASIGVFVCRICLNSFSLMYIML